jgi:hypothetical protein
VIGTHGRSLYVLDVAPLEELTPRVQARRAHLFDIRSVALPRSVTPTPPGERTFAGENPPTGAVIYYRLEEKVGERVEVEVARPTGRVVARLAGPGEPGLHRVVWDLKDRDGNRAAGEYLVRLRAASTVIQKKLRVRLD